MVILWFVLICLVVTLFFKEIQNLLSLSILCLILIDVILLKEQIANQMLKSQLLLELYKLKFTQCIKLLIMKNIIKNQCKIHSKFLYLWAWVRLQDMFKDLMHILSWTILKLRMLWFNLDKKIFTLIFQFQM